MAWDATGSKGELQFVLVSPFSVWCYTSQTLTQILLHWSFSWRTYLAIWLLLLVPSPALVGLLFPSLAVLQEEESV